MTPKEALIAARELISDPAKWTQGYYARDAKGDTVEDDDPSAVCWCIMGAILKVKPRELRLDDVLQPFWAVAPLESVAAVNDTSSHAELLAFVDKAIEAAS